MTKLDMKKLAAISTTIGLLAGNACAQAAAPGSLMQTITVPDDHQPLYPIVYPVIYVGVLLAAAFILYALYRSFRDKTYLQ